MKQVWDLVKFDDGRGAYVTFESIYYDYAYLELYITSYFKNESRNVKIRYAHFDHCKARISKNNPLFKNLNSIFNDDEISSKYKTLILNQFISSIDDTMINFNREGIYGCSASIGSSRYPVLESSNWSDQIILEDDIELLEKIKELTFNYRVLLDEYNEYAKRFELKEMPIECIEYDVSILYTELKKESIIG